jgi:hypothetical protein
MIIRRVGVWSVAKLYGGISATMGLIIGACFALVAMVGGSLANARSDFGVATPGLGALVGVGAIITLPIMYGVLGLVGGAIGAGLYNLFAGIFGGIEVEVQQ